MVLLDSFQLNIHCIVMYKKDMSNCKIISEHTDWVKCTSVLRLICSHSCYLSPPCAFNMSLNKNYRILKMVCAYFLLFFLKSQPTHNSGSIHFLDNHMTLAVCAALSDHPSSVSLIPWTSLRIVCILNTLNRYVVTEWCHYIDLLLNASSRLSSCCLETPPTIMTYCLIIW